MSFELKNVGGRSLLYVMAAKAEYGPHLQARFKPLMTGVGPIEAAIVLTRKLARCAAENRLPDVVISLGSAGSASLEQTEVYQVKSVSYRDMDASALGFPKGRTPFLDLPAEVPLPFQLPEIAAARLSTGGNIISGAAYDLIDADMVDMETFAINRVCQSFDIPLIGLRGISDGKRELQHVGDWTEYLHVIDEKLAAVVDRLETHVANGLIGG